MEWLLDPEYLICRIVGDRDKLCEVSDYFKALLGPNFAESHQNEIVLSGFDAPTLQSVVDYCDSGIIELTAENIESIIEAARSMSIALLEEECCTFLKRNSRAENCVSAFYISDLYSLVDVRAYLFEFICRVFEHIEINDFQFLPEGNLKEFLEFKRINAPEQLLLDVLLSWIEFDERNRANAFKEMLDLINLDLIDTKVSK